MDHKKRIKNKKKSNHRKAINKKKKLKMKNHKKKIETDIQYMIRSLPQEIQRRIYIMTWKLFWREYIPLTSKPPSWLTYHNYVQEKLWESRFKNIHFLHLPFNTLPENKKWIMGCQCEFCKNDTQINIVEKHMHYLIQYRNSYYFTDKFMPKEYSGYWNEYLSPIGDWNNIQFMKIFDPLCGSYKENYMSKNLREGGKFEFTYPII